MASYTRKTFDNSYLFNEETNLHHKVLSDFILKAERIEDKSSDAFRGIVEDVKRMQNSSVLYTILMMDNVVLCINKGQGLSRAFKVFEAKDIRYDKQPKVFIDVTDIISYKDGYFVCKKIDWLITYLFNALGYLLYSKSTLKLIGNSNITIAGTECFVSLFNYIPDYLRIIGYAQNKEKISYLAGLYFIYNIMGKDLDTYSKNIAAKAAGISTSDTRAFELYYNPEKDFQNIKTFVELIAGTFKLKGLTVETFVHKWTYLFGTGTYYATELFTAFMTLMSSAFCGSYIVNQKQIERCCGASMVKFCNAMLQLGISEFDNRGYMEASELDKTIARDKNTMELRESFLNRNKKVKFERKDFYSKDQSQEKAKAVIDYYISVNQEDKISKVFVDAANAVMGYMWSDKKVEEGVLEVILKAGKKYIKEPDKRKINEVVNQSINTFKDDMEEARENGDKEKSSFSAKKMTELRKCKGLI